MALAELGDGWTDRIERVLAAFEVTADSGLVSALVRVLDLTVVWNQKLDLTAARDPDELVDLVLADAAFVAHHHGQTAGARWVDVGSGSGAPGVPLALLLPREQFTLVEPKTKRVAFLRTLLGTLGRADVRVERARADRLGEQSYDLAISRATLPPDAWLAEGTRLATGAVWLLLAQGAPPSCDGWCADLDATYAWPLTRASRRAIRYVPRRR